ncbi:MAG TPA: glycosyltransferase family 39 protein [Burkholderiaceae bacterium]
MHYRMLNAAILGLRNFSTHLAFNKFRTSRHDLDLASTLPSARFFYFTAISVTVLLSAFCFLYGLGSYPLFDTNEGLYAEIAREMLDTGNFIVPHLLGVPYLEKPPLLYWLMAMSFSIFGPSAASARLISAGSMLFLAIMLLIFCRRFGNPRTGIYALIIFSTVVPGTLVSRTVVFDPLLTALMGGCLLSYFQWYMTRKSAWHYAGAIFLALATLEKGGVAIILAVGIIGLFSYEMRDRKALQALTDQKALALFLLIALPWHIAAAMQQQGFAWFYFINEHVLRFFGLRKPLDYHIEPFYFYLIRIPLMLLPWTPLLFLIFRSERAGNNALGICIRFCRAWILFPLLFFSISRAKGGYYLLMILPAVALLLSVEFTRRSHTAIDRTLSCCLAVTGFLGVVALAIALMHESDIRASVTHSEWTIAGILTYAALWLVYSCRHLIFKKHNTTRDAAIFAIGLITTPLLAMTLHAEQARSLTNSSQDIAYLIERQTVHNQKIFVYRNYEDVFSSLPFYLGKKVQVIDSVSADLQFGCRMSEGQNNACVSLPDFKNVLKHFPVAVAVQNDRLEEFYKAAGRNGWRPVAIGDKHVLFNF